MKPTNSQFLFLKQKTNQNQATPPTQSNKENQSSLEKKEFTLRGHLARAKKFAKEFSKRTNDTNSLTPEQESQLEQNISENTALIDKLEARIEDLRFAIDCKRQQSDSYKP